MTDEIAGIGLAWYSREAWRQLEAIPEANIQKSYRDYLRTFEKIERSFTAQGLATKKISIDIDQMIAWCHRNGYEIDHKGRAAYGGMMTMAQDDPEMLNAPVIDKTRVLQ